MMEQGDKQAHIEVFDSADGPAGEIWAAPAATAAELGREASLLSRLGHAGLELMRGMKAIGKIAMNGDLGTMVRDIRHF